MLMSQFRRLMGYAVTLIKFLQLQTNITANWDIAQKNCFYFSNLVLILNLILYRAHTILLVTFFNPHPNISAKGEILIYLFYGGRHICRVDTYDTDKLLYEAVTANNVGKRQVFHHPYHSFDYFFVFPKNSSVFSHPKKRDLSLFWHCEKETWTSGTIHQCYLLFSVIASDGIKSTNYRRNEANSNYSLYESLTFFTHFKPILQRVVDIRTGFAKQNP